jgi:hypothetical protein
MMMLIVAAVILHLATTKFVWQQGTQFYQSGTGLGKIWDMVHESSPDLSKYNYSKNWFLLIYVLPFQKPR